MDSLKAEEFYDRLQRRTDRIANEFYGICSLLDELVADGATEFVQ